MLYDAPAAVSVMMETEQCVAQSYTLNNMDANDVYDEEF